MGGSIFRLYTPYRGIKKCDFYKLKPGSATVVEKSSQASESQWDPHSFRKHPVLALISYHTSSCRALLYLILVFHHCRGRAAFLDEWSSSVISIQSVVHRDACDASSGFQAFWPPPRLASRLCHGVCVSLSWNGISSTGSYIAVLLCLGSPCGHTLSP